MGMMGGNPQNVSIPGLYQQQQQMVNSGMLSGAPQSQISPDYLRQLSMLGLQGAGGSNVQGQGQGPGRFSPGGVGMDPRGRGMSGGGSGYAGGESGFRSMAPFGGPGNGNWMPGWMQPTPQGSMTGLNLAENGRSIGMGLGAATGIPGLGVLGNYMGNQYINNHMFQSPSNARAPGLGPVTFNDYAQMNSSQGFGGPRGGNQHAGMPSDFRTQFNWAHNIPDGSDQRLHAWGG